MSGRRHRARDERIPWRLNALLLALASSGSLALLWTASHARSAVVIATAALAFSFVNNTVFSLLHEAVHGLFHPHPRVNEWFGRWLAAFFPTGLTFQRTCHLGHHRRNRTAVELFDYVDRSDVRVVKVAQWYGILTGVYWLVPPLGCLAFLVLPRRALSWLLDTRGSAVVEHVGADAMLGGFTSVPASRVRAEILLTIALQVVFCVALDLSLVGWLACYAAFGVNWSSLQYADHAWSELDVRNGAWNLRVNRVWRALFLNYHDHLAHHQHPDVPWLHLGRYVDPNAPRPSFARIYASMWRGPRRLPDDAIVPRAGERAA